MKIESHPLDVPQEIAALQLYSMGGFTVVSDLLGEQDLTSLRNEAIAVRSQGDRSAAPPSDEFEERGGCPGRSFRSALGLERQLRLLTSPETLASLTQIVGGVVTLAGSGSFTYYEEPGDFLDLHRDIAACEVAVITCLDAVPPMQGGGSLLVYPEFCERPLASVRAAGRAAGTPVQLHPGESVVMLGGVLPHEVSPMVPGQERVVSVMCYGLRLC